MSESVEQLLAELEKSVINGKHEEAEQLTDQLLVKKVGPKEILDGALLKDMNIVGERFCNQELFIPHVLVAAHAMKAFMKILQPMLANDKIETKGKVLIGTVKGDVHDIGKNLVVVMLEDAGYKVIDIGIGKTDDDFLNEYEKLKLVVVGLSALLASTMIYMKEVIDVYRNENINVPIIVGVAQVNQNFADEIGATAFGKNSYEAVKIIDQLGR